MFFQTFSPLVSSFSVSLAAVVGEVFNHLPCHATIYPPPPHSKCINRRTSRSRPNLQINAIISLSLTENDTFESLNGSRYK